MLDWHSCQICYPLEIKSLSLFLLLLLKSRTNKKIIFCSFHTGSKARVFFCPRFFSPLCDFDWTVKPVNQFSRRYSSMFSIFSQFCPSLI